MLDRVNHHFLSNFSLSTTITKIYIVNGIVYRGKSLKRTLQAIPLGFWKSLINNVEQIVEFGFWEEDEIDGLEYFLRKLNILQI